MTIKRKIRVLQVSLCLLMVLLCTFMLWKLVLIRHDLKHINSCTDIVLTFQQLRNSLHDQEHQVAHLLAWDKEQYRVAFQEDSRTVTKHFQTLKEQRSTQSAWDGMDNEASCFSELEVDYMTFLRSIDTVFALYDGGRLDEARVFLEEQLEDVVQEKLYTDLDRLVTLRMENIHNHYRRIMAHVGFLPWVLRATLSDINEATKALDYTLALGTTTNSLNLLEMELMEYLNSGNKEDLDELRFLERESYRYVDNLHWIIAQQEKQGVEGEAEDRQRLEALEAHLRELLPKREEIIAAKQAGLETAELSSLDESSHDQLEKQLEPLIVDLVEDSYLEMQTIHEELLQRATLFFSLSATLLLLGCSIGMVVLFRSGNHFLASLAMLGEGAELIRRGELGQRIDLQTPDELGALSTTFDLMSKALEDKRDELQNFIHIVSHDLRAPLVSLHGFTHILRNDISTLKEAVPLEHPALTKGEREHLSELMTHRIPESLGFISSSAERMDRLVDAVLKLSRTGQIALRPEPVKLAEVAELLLGSMAHQIATKNVSVTVGSLPVVIADPFSIEQILGNLIDNALKYLDPGRPGEVQITAMYRSGETVIQVKDNGRGIAAENQSCIFDIFRRGGHPDVSGEGVGLALVKRLLERQGGRIWCESIPGEGSTFNFTLPGPPASAIGAPLPESRNTARPNDPG